MEKATGTDFRKLRLELKMTLKELSIRLKISPNTLATWEHKKQKQLSAPGNFIYRHLLNETAALRAEQKKLGV